MTSCSLGSTDPEWDIFHKGVIDCVSTSVQQLREIWSRIGISGQVLKDRYEAALDYYKDLSTRMYEEDIGLYDRLMSTVEGHLFTLQEYCNDLGMEMPVVEEAPPLLLKHTLVSMIEKLAVLRESRLNKLQELRQKEDKLCNCLSMEAHVFCQERAVPTEQDLDELAQHIEMLSKEKVARQRKYMIIRSDIVRVMAVLEKKPETSLEQELCTELEDAELLLSQDKLTAMKNLHEQLTKEKEKAMVLLEEHTGKVIFLWDNLQEDEQHQREFLAQNDHCGSTALIALEREISRCQDLRMANMGHFVNNLRQELVTLWKKCHASEEQMNAFQGFMNSCYYTEDLLKAHEQEVTRWRAFYQTFQNLFQGIEKIGALFHKALQLQLKPNEAGRLYNRGGQLLKEEKERNKLLQQIPKMEHELLTLAAQYEDTLGSSFTVDGLTVAEYLRAQWNLLYQEKENEKLQRKHRKEGQLSVITPQKVARDGASTPFKTPSNRGTPGVILKNTPMKSRKQILKSSMVPTPASTSAVRSSPYQKRQITPKGAEGPSTISFSYSTFEKKLNDSVRPTNKRSTMNSSISRSPKVLGSRVTPQFTNSGIKRRRYSRSPLIKSLCSRSPTKLLTTVPSAGKELKVPAGNFPFLL